MRNSTLVVLSMLVVACGGPLDETDDTQAGVHELGGKVHAKKKDAPKKGSKNEVVVPVKAAASVTVAESLNPLVVKTSFSAQTAREIHFLGSVSGLSGNHQAIFEVVAPGPSPYQVFNISFSDSNPSVALPVSGTFITQFAIYGTWSVSMFIDGSGTAAATTTFTIQP